MIYIERSETDEKQKKTKYHGSITDACNDKCLSCCITIFRFPVPESDQQITAKAYSFPSEIQQQQVVSKDKNQHRADKQVHICKKPGEAFIFIHEFNGIKMNKRSDKSYYKTKNQR